MNKPLHTDEFKLQANTLKVDLLAAAQEGRVTSQKPITAKKIIERYKVLHPQWELSDGQIRALVNYLRSQGEKIGSNTQGYFYMLHKSEEDHVANQIESRITEMLAAYAGVFPDRTKGLAFRLNSALTHGKGQQTIFQ